MYACTAKAQAVPVARPTVHSALSLLVDWVKALAKRQRFKQSSSFNSNENAILPKGTLLRTNSNNGCASKAT